MHTAESYKLTEAIKGAKRFSDAQKSLMLLNLAVYTKDVSTMLECFSCMGNQINKKLAQVTPINQQTPDSLLIDKLSKAEENHDILKLENLLIALNKEHFKL